MERKEFIEKARQIGYTEEEITEILDLHDSARKAGLIPPDYAEELIERPVALNK